MTRIRTSSRTLNIVDIEGNDLTVQFQPYSEDDILAHITDDKVVVAYLVHDDDSSDSPMEDGTCNGELVTNPDKRNHIVSDNMSALLGHLYLHDRNEPDIDHEFVLGTTRTTLRDIAVQEFLATMKGSRDLQADWFSYSELPADTDFISWLRRCDPDCRYDNNLGTLMQDLGDDNGCFWEEIGTLAHSLYSKHWKTIVGPYVLPISVFHERGEGSYVATSWDGDPDDLPDGVWVACKDAMENITPMAEGAEVSQVQGPDGKYTSVYQLTMNGVQVTTGTLGWCLDYMRLNYKMDHSDLERAVEKYAGAILKEYSQWASGEVFGCVVEMYERQENGSWEMTKDESCWRFIGHDWAMEALKDEFFEPFVRELTQQSEGAINGQ